MQMHCGVTPAKFSKKDTAMITMDNDGGAAPVGPTRLSTELFQLCRKLI